LGDRGDLRKMKLLLIIYSEDIDRQVLIALRQAGAKNFTQWEKVLGVGSSGVRLGTEVGPGTNKMVLTLIKDEDTESLLERLRNLKQSFLRRQGLKVIVLPVSGVV